jgi:4-hydroxybenzoate polyprenyltransferase
MTKFQTYAQLVRLPNVFTALADIALAALAAGAIANAGAWPAFLLLLLASGCLYCGGMVWNDFFDVEQDRQERPFRPLPSGRVKPQEALRLGASLLGAGVLLAGLAGWLEDPTRWTPFLLALILSATILLYDGWLKRTWAGPLGMGACRFLNVLLGLAVVPGSIGSWGFVLALAVGVYITGVTWFARTEARASNQDQLLLAGGAMLAGLLLALPLPVLAANRAAPVATSPLFLYLLVGFGFMVGIPVARAIQQPSPSRVQAAVKTAVLGLVVFDTVLATALAGLAGLTLLVLLPPALYLGRWIYST